MSVQRVWEVVPDVDLSDRVNWRELANNRYGALRITMLIIATSGKESRLGEIVESYPLGPNEEITLTTKEVRSITNTESIKAGLRYAVTSRICDRLATKVSSEIGAKVPGFNGRISAAVDAGTEQELIKTAENTYEGTASHTLQESTEREFTISLKGAPKPRTAHLRKRYWRHTWDLYLHSYDYLELEYRKNWIWPNVRSTIRQASSFTIMLPLFRIEFFAPQANLNVSYDGVEELEDPYAIRIMSLTAGGNGAIRPNAPNLEDFARLAFPATRAEKAARARHQAAKKENERRAWSTQKNKLDRGRKKSGRSKKAASRGYAAAKKRGTRLAKKSSRLTAARKHRAVKISAIRKAVARRR